MTAQDKPYNGPIIETGNERIFWNVWEEVEVSSPGNTETVRKAIDRRRLHAALDFLTNHLAWPERERFLIEMQNQILKGVLDVEPHENQFSIERNEKVRESLLKRIEAELKKCTPEYQANRLEFIEGMKAATALGIKPS